MAGYSCQRLKAATSGLSMAMREQRLDEGLQELGWKCARGLYIVER